MPTNGEGDLVAQQMVTLDVFLRAGKVQRGNNTLLHWILRSSWPADIYHLMPDDRAMEAACFSCISNTIKGPFPCNRTVLIMHISLCCIPQGLVSPNDVTLDYSSCIQACTTRLKYSWTPWWQVHGFAWQNNNHAKALFNILVPLLKASAYTVNSSRASWVPEFSTSMQVL